MLGSAIWQCALPVQPGQQVAVQFDATPKQPGPIDSVIEVQVGFFPKTARIKVQVEAASAAPAPAKR
jgi:hypothetical protein